MILETDYEHMNLEVCKRYYRNLRRMWEEVRDGEGIVIVLIERNEAPPEEAWLIKSVLRQLAKRKDSVGRILMEKRFVREVMDA
ncbi:MAG: hypothetical protein HYV34_03795 [Candidatus Kerfeldbacteria bacterium]|nr:hypothetical protein [Candidatus Kerfeldbacteria bacterium]